MVFALGCASVLFMALMVGGTGPAFQVGIAIVTLFTFGSVCGIAYLVFVLVSKRRWNLAIALLAVFALVCASAFYWGFGGAHQQRTRAHVGYP